MPTVTSPVEIAAAILGLDSTDAGRLIANRYLNMWEQQLYPSAWGNIENLEKDLLCDEERRAIRDTFITELIASQDIEQAENLVRQEVAKLDMKRLHLQLLRFVKVHNIFVASLFHHQATRLTKLGKSVTNSKGESVQEKATQYLLTAIEDLKNINKLTFETAEEINAKWEMINEMELSKMSVLFCD